MKKVRKKRDKRPKKRIVDRQKYKETNNKGKNAKRILIWIGAG